MAYRVFVSHSSADAAAVRRISTALERIDVTVYAYEDDPKPGTLLADKIKKEISASDALVVLLTSRGSASAWVQQEIGLAEMAGKLVIPLVESDVDRRQLALLTGREHVSYDAADPGSAMAQLSAFLTKAASKKAMREWLVGLGVIVFVLLGLYLLNREETETAV